MGAPQIPISVAIQRKIATGEHYNLYSVLLPTLCTYLTKNYHNSHLKPHRLKMSVMHN